MQKRCTGERHGIREDCRFRKYTGEIISTAGSRRNRWRSGTFAGAFSSKFSTRCHLAAYTYDDFTARAGQTKSSAWFLLVIVVWRKKVILPNISNRAGDRWESASSRGCDDPQKTPCTRTRSKTAF